MGKYAFLIPGLTAVVMILLLQTGDGADIGSLKCKNGSWVPDLKLIGFGLSCPLPLDGKMKSKGKTTTCALKKLKVYDGKTVKKDQIAPEICSALPQDDYAKKCKETIHDCLHNDPNGKWFEDPKKDKEYATWAPAYDCVHKWATSACKKTTTKKGK